MYVPEIFADAIVELAIQTIAEMKTVQLVDATAWAPKQMRRNFRKIQDYMHQNMETPDWVTEIRTRIRSKRAKEAEDLDEQGKADAWKRMGGAAPGEPGGLANAKPKVPGTLEAPKWNPKNRGLEQPPHKHLDDLTNFDDDKNNKNRPVGTFARFATTGGGRSKTQLHKWCVCDQSKGTVNKESPTYLGHWASTQGNPLQSNTHRNAGKDGSTFGKFKVDKAKAAAASSGKGKARAPAATSITSSTVAEADLKRATAHIEQLKVQIKELGASRDAEHLKHAKATELANTQLNLQAQKMNEMIGVDAKTLRSSQIETAKAITKINEICGQCEGFAPRTCSPRRRKDSRPTWTRRGRPLAAC